jgi:hypothetical protein
VGGRGRIDRLSTKDKEKVLSIRFSGAESNSNSCHIIISQLGQLFLGQEVQVV